MWTYEELKQKIDDIRNAETPEDAGALILALENEIAKVDDDKQALEARIKELETDVVSRDERIKNLLKRNEDLRYSLGEQYKREEVKDEEIKEDRYKVTGLEDLDEII